MAVVIGPIANLGNIREITEAILEASASSDVCSLDLSQADEADLTLLQVLAATAKMAERDSKSLTHSQPPSEAVIALMERAGFANLPGWQDNFCNAGAAGQ